MLDFIWTPAFLGVAGGVLEVVGLTRVIYVANRERRERFGILSAPRRLLAWIRFWLIDPPGRPVTLEVGGGGGARSCGGADVSIVNNETDIERLTREVRELRARQVSHERTVANRIDETNRRVNDVAAELHQQVRQIVDTDHRDRRSTLRDEVLGARVFMAGAILSALANVAPQH